jgi:hypothetical protein
MFISYSEWAAAGLLPVEPRETRMRVLIPLRQAVLPAVLAAGTLVLLPAGPVLAQEVASAVAVADGDPRGTLQVAAPAALVRPSVILRREGNVLSVLVLPAAEEPPLSNSSPQPPTTEFMRPRPITNYGGYGSGYQGIYGSGHGDGDGHCELYFVASGGWCPTVTVTGTPIGAP